MEPTLVTIPQNEPGLRDFIGAWVLRDPNVVIDVGPSSSVGRLVDSLLGMGVERVDYVLLTHIHLDHAGGIAGFLDRFSTAKVLCHQKGIRHLVSPAKLWEASRKTLGEVALQYGPPSPVDEGRFIPHTEAAVPGLRVIETPGHAAHHLSFVYQGHLFAGEAAGVHYGVWDYLRPAAPPPYFIEDGLASIDRLIALGDLPICYAHAGRCPSSRAMLERERAQILRWKGIIEREVAKPGEDILPRCLGRVLELDPDLKGLDLMGEEDRRKESFYVSNAVRGFLGALSPP